MDDIFSENPLLGYELRNDYSNLHLRDSDLKLPDITQGSMIREREENQYEYSPIKSRDNRQSTEHILS
jgi:hypothetical protein